jgi:hypothetical protein
MSSLSLGLALSALTPAALMTLVAVRGRLLPADEPPAAAWSFFRRGAGLALAAALLTVLLQLLRQWRGAPLPVVEDLLLSPLSAWVALLVQFLGTVIGVFSSRYLQGEPGQGRYMGRLAGVLAGVRAAAGRPLAAADRGLGLGGPRPARPAVLLPRPALCPAGSTRSGSATAWPTCCCWPRGRRLAGHRQRQPLGGAGPGRAAGAGPA